MRPPQALEVHREVVKQLHAAEGRAVSALDAAVKTLRQADRSPAGTRSRAKLERVQRALASTQMEATSVRAELDRASDLVQAAPGAGR